MGVTHEMLVQFSYHRTQTQCSKKKKKKKRKHFLQRDISLQFVCVSNIFCDSSITVVIVAPLWCTWEYFAKALQPCVMQDKVLRFSFHELMAWSALCYLQCCKHLFKTKGLLTPDSTWAHIGLDYFCVSHRITLSYTPQTLDFSSLLSGGLELKTMPTNVQ